MLIGNRSPGRAENTAPHARNGSITRRIGRLRKLASPVITEKISWLAKIPASSRAAVPELPISNTSSGAVSPPIPRPATSQSAPSRQTSAPSARIAAAVRRTSSPSSKPVILVSPTASAPNINAR